MPNLRMTDAEYWEDHPLFTPINEAVAGADPPIRTSHFPLGDPEDPETPVAVVLQMGPGFVISHHGHDSERFEMVVQGSIDVGDKVLRPGDVMTAHARELYGPKVCGPEGCTTVEFFTNVKAACETIVATPDGAHVAVNYALGERPPAQIAGMEGVAERQRAVLDSLPKSD